VGGERARREGRDGSNMGPRGTSPGRVSDRELVARVDRGVSSRRRGARTSNAPGRDSPGRAGSSPGTADARARAPECAGSPVSALSEAYRASDRRGRSRYGDHGRLGPARSAPASTRAELVSSCRWVIDGRCVLGCPTGTLFLPTTTHKCLVVGAPRAVDKFALTHGISPRRASSNIDTHKRTRSLAHNGG
jgi:hypothetical protein